MQTKMKMSQEYNWDHLCWPATPGMESALRCGWYTQQDNSGEIQFFHCQCILTTESSLVRGQSPCLLPPHTPHQCWESVWCKPVQALCAAWTLKVHVCISPVASGRRGFLGCTHLLRLLPSFYLVSSVDPWAFRISYVLILLLFPRLAWNSLSVSHACLKDI